MQPGRSSYSRRIPHHHAATPRIAAADEGGVSFWLPGLFDWGASQFLTKQFQVGVVGYVYNEVGCDSGSGDRVGCFQSRVVGVGPQIGYIIPLGTMQAYINVKGYGEFDAQNRAHGWNAWLTVQLAPAPPGPAPPPSRTRSMYTK